MQICVYMCGYIYICRGVYAYTHKYIPVSCGVITEDKAEKANKVAVKFHFYDLDNTGERETRRSRELIESSFYNKSFH